jgi:hypothetical protein
MLIYSKKIFYLKMTHYVFSMKNKNPFCSYFEKLYDKLYGFRESLDLLHKILDDLPSADREYNTSIHTIGKDDRRSVFIQDFHHDVDYDYSFRSIYYKFIDTHMRDHFPGEEKLLIQRTPNLRISFPNTTAIGKHAQSASNDVVGLHRDADFGHHFTETNFIIPITDMYESNSLYYEPTIHSSLVFEAYTNLRMTTDQYFMGCLNQLKHYNKINTTRRTRMSLDFRVIPFSSYEAHLDDFMGTKFEAGKQYYTLYQLI